MAQHTSPLNVVCQQACRHMLSKGMFLTGLINPLENDDAPHDDGYCWCNRTQGQLGPDARTVDHASCQEGRTCYEPR
jgi:hypothetical protein